MNRFPRAPYSSLLIVVNILILSATTLAADAVNCPQRIEVNQHLTTPVSGWQSTLDDAPHQFAGITFYDGQPQEKASLVYDSMTKAGGKQVARWNFTAEAGRATWVACSYSGSSVQLVKSLPATIKSCEVTYNPRERLAGLPLIEKIDCK
jgi:hypothetical protein